MKPIYDTIGTRYSVGRRTDPKIAAQIFAELRGATRIVNIGAGTGSYEPDGVDLVAVEPSSAMITQRSADAYPVEQAFAENLPFGDKTFSHAMTVLSMHHWEDRERAFREISRVTTERFIAVTWDPEAERFWLTRDYFPEIHTTDEKIFPSLDEIEKYFNNVQGVPLPIPEDCVDGMLAAFWKRPGAYLDPAVRRCMSSFAKIENLSHGLDKLRQDLADGTWAEKNHAILSAPSLDVGYKLITADIRQEPEGSGGPEATE